MLKFSIIVPIYNVSNYLEECIESLVRQTYDNLEIVLVNDGSTDNSLDICLQYAESDKRIIIVNKENGGPTSAKKAGLEKATGNYIVVVDGDDKIPENSLQIYSETISRYNPDIIVAGYFIYNEHNCSQVSPRYVEGYYSRRKIEEVFFPSLIQDSNARYFTPQQWAKTYKRDIIYNCQMSVDDRIFLGEDGACVIPCVYNSQSLYICKEPTYYYRYNPQSITNNKKAFRWDGPKLIHKHFEKTLNLDLYDFRKQLYRKTTHEVFSVVVSQFYRRESYRSIRQSIIKELADATYNEAIKKASFKSMKAKLMSFTLKTKLLFPIYLYSRLK